MNQVSKIQEPSGKRTHYSYDLNGNRWKERIIEGSSDITKFYVCNDQNRLMSVTDYKVDGSSTSVTYKYDNNGNQLYALEEQVKIKKEE